MLLIYKASAQKRAVEIKHEVTSTQRVLTVLRLRGNTKEQME
jgi:hypothetical protein